MRREGFDHHHHAHAWKDLESAYPSQDIESTSDIRLGSTKGEAFVDRGSSRETILWSFNCGGIVGAVFQKPISVKQK